VRLKKRLQGGYQNFEERAVKSNKVKCGARLISEVTSAVEKRLGLNGT